MHTDSLLYRLFQERPALAFTLAGLDIPAAADYRMQAIEVKQTAFRLDGVLLPPAGHPELPIIFTEAQFQGRPTFYGRWLAAIFLYLYRHRVTRPWQAVVVFPHPGVDTGHLTPYESLLNCGLLRRVYLQDLLGLDGLGLDARLARLIILDAAQAPAEARALVATPDPGADPLEMLDLVETILVYKFPTLSREEIRAMLHLPERELKKTRFYQEVFGEGRQEGRQEGWQEGRQEGRQEGVADTLLRLVTAKFGPPTSVTRQRLASADTETLLRWSERILKADSLDELFGDLH